MFDGYSQMQRFFLNRAVTWHQKLSPTNVACAFGCAPGDGMWRDPDDRAGVW